MKNLIACPLQAPRRMSRETLYGRSGGQRIDLYRTCCPKKSYSGATVPSNLLATPKKRKNTIIQVSCWVSPPTCVVGPSPRTEQFPPLAVTAKCCAKGWAARAYLSAFAIPSSSQDENREHNGKPPHNNHIDTRAPIRQILWLIKGFRTKP